jgi:hypothetical protein
MSVATKSIQIARHTTPRLQHTAATLSLLSDRDAKITHLTALCDANGLPAAAGREEGKRFAKQRGIRLGTDAIAQVVKARKAKGQGSKFPDLTPQVRTGEKSAENADHAEKSGEVSTLEIGPPEHELPDLNLSCQLRSGRSGDPDLRAAAFKAALGVSPVNHHNESHTCAACGDPMSDERAAYGKTLCLDCDTAAATTTTKERTP